MRIVMWSGPRNLSTAMMYAFGARPDFAVWDEPFYGAYLQETGLDHPMRSEILASELTRAAEVAARCIGPIPDGKPHFYMKHMAHHMVDGFPLDWTECCTNIHLLRHPARVVASYAAKRERPTLDDIGYRQQVEVFRKVGGLVVDSSEIRARPREALAALCAAIGLQRDDRMLSWPKGGHVSDGVWAAHWYGSAHASTGFAGPEGPLPTLERSARELSDAAMPFYDELSSKCMKLTS